jgi:hypothetical protein
MYNVTVRRVRVSIVTVEKQKLLHILVVCLCSLRYPACKAHAPYYIVTCGLSGLQYFSTLSNSTARFKKKTKVIEYKMCFDFSTTFV